MNFYDLFEAKKDKDEQEVKIRDPKAARALDVAGGKYAYADTDLEAFVKMMQDEQEDDAKEFDKLETETERQEREITRLKKHDEEYAKEINNLEKTNDLLQRQVTLLRQAEAGYSKKISAMTQADHSYKTRIETIQNDLTDLELRLASVVKGFKPKTTKAKTELPDPSELESIPNFGDADIT